MKKFLIFIAIATCIAFIFDFVKSIPQYRFGYFVSGPVINNPTEDDPLHSIGQALKLQSGDVIILGSNDHKSPYKNSWSIDNLVIKEDFSQIYNHKKNLFEYFKLPNNIVYWPEGMMLDNNRLLLTFAYNLNGNIKYSEYGSNMEPPYPYDSIAIINLQAGKVEKILRKKINKDKQPYRNSAIFTLLGNRKLLITDNSNNGYIEIYNLETGLSKLIKNPHLKNIEAVIAKGENKALMFGQTMVSENKYKYVEFRGELDGVLEYDDTNETIRPVGKALWRSRFFAKKASKDKIIIFGGKIEAKCPNSKKVYLNGGNSGTYTIKPPCDTYDIREIEIYDTNTNKSKIVAELMQGRMTYQETTFNGMPLNDRYFLFAGGEKYSQGSVLMQGRHKTTEVLDLKTGKIYKGPEMKMGISNFDMTKLNNGDILITKTGRIYDGRSTQIFKTEKHTGLMDLDICKINSIKNYPKCTVLYLNAMKTALISAFTK